MKQLKLMMKLIRVKHWVKNLLIFIPIIFNGDLLNIGKLKQVVWGWMIFCLISSVVYIINDLNDYTDDQNNEVKKHRPIASGEISARTAFLIAILFIALACISCFLRKSLVLLILPLFYLILNILYTYKLRSIPIIDVFSIALGFCIRVYYGSSVIDILLSKWVYLAVLSGSIYLALGKRRNELMNYSINGRYVLSYYTSAYLEKNMYLCLTLCLVFYSLSCIALDTKIAQLGKDLTWTIPLVLLISLKYNLTLENATDGDPTEIIFSDKILLLLIITLAIGIILSIYI